MFRGMKGPDARRRSSGGHRAMRAGLVVGLAVFVLAFWGYNLHRVVNISEGGYDRIPHESPPPSPLSTETRDVEACGGQAGYGEMYTYSPVERWDPFRPRKEDERALEDVVDGDDGYDTRMMDGKPIGGGGADTNPGPRSSWSEIQGDADLGHGGWEPEGEPMEIVDNRTRAPRTIMLTGEPPPPRLTLKEDEPTIRPAGQGGTGSAEMIAVQGIPRPDLSYRGIVKSGNEILALVGFRGQEHIVREGDTLEGLELVHIEGERLTIRSGKQAFEYPLGGE